MQRSEEWLFHVPTYLVEQFETRNFWGASKPVKFEELYRDLEELHDALRELQRQKDTLAAQAKIPKHDRRFWGLEGASFRFDEAVKKAMTYIREFQQKADRINQNVRKGISEWEADYTDNGNYERRRQGKSAPVINDIHGYLGCLKEVQDAKKALWSFFSLLDLQSE